MVQFDEGGGGVHHISVHHRRMPPSPASPPQHESQPGGDGGCHLHRMEAAGAAPGGSPATVCLRKYLN